MKTKPWIVVSVIFTACAIVSPVQAQNLLQRLTEQFTQQSEQPPPPLELPPPVENPAVPGPSRASLGIRVAPVTDDLIRDQRLIVRHGAVITAIEQGSAADRAGLPLGGVIVAVNGKVVNSPNDLVLAMQAARPGQELELTYYDRNKLARKKVHLGPGAVPNAVAVPNDPRLPLTRVPAQPAPAAPAPSANLERELGGDGSRPLLGRLGRVIDTIAQPPAAVVPAEATTVARPETSEISALREQVAELAKQVVALRQQVTDLEKKIANSKTNE